MKQRAAKDVIIYEDELVLDKIQSAIVQMFKEKHVADQCCADFIEKGINDWITRKPDNEETETLSNALTILIGKSCNLLDIYLPIVYAGGKFNFNIVEVNFRYLPSGHFSSIAPVLSKAEVGYRVSFADFEQMIYGHIQVYAERQKAIDIAEQKIGLAVDLLKCFSPIVDEAEKIVWFEMDRRVSVRGQRRTVIIDPTKPGFQALLQEVDRNYEFNELLIKTAKARGLDEAIAVIEKNNLSEIEKLVHVGIRHFSRALSIEDKAEKIASLFTVIESLVLKDETASIIESMRLYFPKIIFQNIGERKKITDTMRRLYDVRSAYMHHAKRSIFSISDLKLLQKIVFRLLKAFIALSNMYKKKSKISFEIQ